MEFVIYFVGLIMIVKSDDIGGTVGSYHALIPEWKLSENVCSHQMPEHALYIRVPTNSIVSADTSWPASEVTSCATLPCTLFRIPVESTLAVSPGFVPTPGIALETPFCLPRLETRAAPGKKPKLDAGSKTRTLADFEMTGGTLGAYAFTNGMIFTTWTLTPPGAPTNSDIELTATARGGSGTVRKLTVKAKTRIYVLNIPPVFAGIPLNTPNPSTTPDHHEKLYQKIVQPGTGDCNMPKEPCTPPVKPGTTLNLACSNTGCC